MNRRNLFRKAMRTIDTAGDQHEEMTGNFARRVCLWFCKDCEETQVIESYVSATTIARTFYYRFGKVLKF